MTYINTEHMGGDEDGTHGREGTETGDAVRQPGRFRRRVLIRIGAVGAAAIAAASVIYTNEPYAENLQMIRSQTVRNTLQDGSPFRDLHQDELPTATGAGLVDTNRAAYLGNPNGNPEQSFPVGGGGQFRTSCEFSHFAYDDPLLFPRQPGAAHLHMFFGNTDVNAYSTYDTLIDSGGSTCNGGELNRTGYWHPAIIDPSCDLGGACVRIPERIVVYYKGEGLANGANYPQFPNSGAQPYPRKLAHIANVQPTPGNGISIPEHPTFDGGQAGEVNYKCTNNFSPFHYASGVNSIPNCDGDYYQNTFGAPYPATRTVLELELKFWNCFPVGGNPEDWTLWEPSGDTRGSWFYSNCNGEGGQGAGAPPLGDKIIYPNLVVYANYVVEPGNDTSDWFLSSDVTGSGGGATVGPRGASLHSDWWGGWHPDINQEFLDECVNFNNGGTASGCGFGYLSDGGPNSGSPLPGRALAYRQQYDTVGDLDSYRVDLGTVFAELCAPLGPGFGYSSAASGANCL